MILRKVQWYYRKLRKLFFTRERPKGTYIIVDATIKEVKEALAAGGFAPNWTLSFNYRGEDLNMAKVFHSGTISHPDYEWWQIHVRGWVINGNVELNAHIETEPTEHPSAHWNKVGVEINRALTFLRIVLNQSDLNVVGEKEYGRE